MVFERIIFAIKSYILFLVTNVVYALTYDPNIVLPKKSTRLFRKKITQNLDDVSIPVSPEIILKNSSLRIENSTANFNLPSEHQHKLIKIPDYPTFSEAIFIDFGMQTFVVSSNPVVTKTANIRFRISEWGSWNVYVKSKWGKEEHFTSWSYDCVEVHMALLLFEQFKSAIFPRIQEGLKKQQEIEVKKIKNEQEMFKMLALPKETF